MTEKKENTLEPTVGMAVLDLVPVVFFAASMFFVALFFNLESTFLSVLFGIGAALSVFAGLGKVIWKFLLATKKKNVPFFKKQFRYFMVAGFVIMILACIRYASHIESDEIFEKVLWNFPMTIFLFIGVGLFIAMCVYGIKADMNTARANWIEEILNALAQFFIFAYVVFTFFVLMAL